MKTERRVGFGIRLKSADKADWAKACEADGVDASVAARQVIELLLKRLRGGESYVSLIARMDASLQTLKPVVRIQAGRAP